MNAIEFDRVSVRYREREALSGVSLAVARGESVAVIGRNGAGKSTLLAAAAGLVTVSAGAVRSVRPVGVVLQRPSLDRLLTVEQNLRFFVAVCGEPVRPIEALLAEFGLADRARDRVGTLSGGLTRRVDLVRAVMSGPEVLILDEPTAGLDAESRAAFGESVRTFSSDRAAAVLWATHHDDEAARADRVIVLDAGRVIRDGPPASFSPGAGLMRVTIGAEPSRLTSLAELPALAAASLAGGCAITIEPAGLIDAAIAAENSAEIGADRGATP
jgi:ABC-2 type transport system ATP-binding protein